MATSEDFIEFVVEQLGNIGTIRYRKMFGEYMLYLNNKPIFLICNSTVYVKKIAELEEKMKEAGSGIPYDGAKEHYILDIDDEEFTKEVASILENVLPLPKPKKKKA